MSDMFKLFDGSFAAGGNAAIQKQDASSFSEVQPENELISTISSGTNSVELLVDYSDFSNFVTFNSAESYVIVTADQILNEYPFGGNVNDLQNFINSLDGYQKYFLKNWPSRTGYLKFDPSISSSYISILDFGVDSGVSRSSFISPGTGSLSIQSWIDIPSLTGSDDVYILFQKLQNSTTNGLSVYASGTNLYFLVQSGSNSQTVSASLSSNPLFFSAVLDRSLSTSSISLYTATTGTYPALSDNKSTTFGARFDLESGSFYIGSGSIAGKITRYLTGSIDDLSVWSSAKNLQSLSGTFNRKIFAQPDLIAAWRFNDAKDTTESAYSSVVRDSSGHRLDGRIQNFFSSIRYSGSIAYDYPDPILTFNDSDVVDYIVNAQISGASYDKSNQSLIFNLFPESFSANNDNSDAFKNFALILARHFDRIKLYINQLTNLRKVKYGEFDQAPNELLDEIGKMIGFPLGASFANSDALKYFLSRNVQSGVSGNSTLDKTMSSIKTDFWRRAILNSIYIYKTKGTEESIRAFLKVYGVGNNFIRIKEYAKRSEAQLIDERVASEKSSYAVMFCSGSSISIVGA